MHRFLPLLLLLASLCSASAADYHLTSSGAGDKTGASWATAFSISQLRATLNTILQPGDTLYLGSGSYNFGKDDRDTDIPRQFYIEANSGTAEAPIRVIGVDTGTGPPLLSKPTSNWNIYNPGSGQSHLIRFSNGVDHWHLENLRIRNIKYGIRTGFDSSATANQYVGLRFKNITIDTVRHGMEFHNCDDLHIQGCTVTEYSKRGIGFPAGCDNVMVRDCYVDMVGAQDEAVWWTSPSESFPFGFAVDNRPEVNNVGVGAFNTNITFQNCVSKRNRKTSPSGTNYWNGDGFVIEGGHTGTRFIRCISLNNEDGGFDLKEPSELVDCVAFMNARQYRCWRNTGQLPFTLKNCVGGFPLKRGPSNGTGMIWSSEAQVSASNVSFHTTGSGTCLETDLSAATIEVRDSLFHYAGPTAGNYTQGSGVETFINCIRYPANGGPPAFVNPHSKWEGEDSEMNSLTYPDLGYSSLRLGGYWGLQAWQSHYFGADATSPAAADGADYDADGVRNLIEFALQTDPTHPSAASSPRITTVDNGGEQYLEMTVQKRPWATHLIYTTQVSPDLATWLSGPLHTTTVEETSTLLRVRDNTPVSTGLPRYMRLQVTALE